MKTKCSKLVFSKTFISPRWSSKTHVIRAVSSAHISSHTSCQNRQLTSCQTGKNKNSCGLPLESGQRHHVHAAIPTKSTHIRTTSVLKNKDLLPKFNHSKINLRVVKLQSYQQLVNVSVKVQVG